MELTASHEKPRQDAPILSVIIPAYNVEACLGDCLDSILRQKIDSMEVIVANDCSTDGTWDVIQKYAQKDKRVVPLTFPPERVNNGPSAPRNLALNAARGKYIHFCDGDDMVPDGAYAELIRVAELEQADLVTGNYSRKYPDKGGVVKPFSHYSAPTGKERCFESGNSMLWNKIYRRDFIKRNNLCFQEGMILYEDFLFFSQFMLAEPKVAYTNKSIYIYTEPVQRGVGGKIRYANFEGAVCFDKTWRTILSSADFKEDVALWRRAYIHNLGWYYNWSWLMIQDFQEKKQAFEIMRRLIRWVQERREFCDWQSPDYRQRFIDIFHVDYSTFCTINFNEYLLIIAMNDHICPRKQNMTVARELQGMTYELRNEKLCDKVKQQLGELQAIHQVQFTNKRVGKEQCWNLLDSLVNDYWRMITDRDKKEVLFEEIKRKTNTLIKECPYCKITTPDELWHFKQIFCMDNAALQSMTMLQYLVACNSGEMFTKSVGMADELDSSAVPNLIFMFINACEKGMIGMRAITQAMKGWLLFKIRRKKA